MEGQILELEKKYWQGVENNDYEIVRNLTLFPCIVAGKNGIQSISEADFKNMFDSGQTNKIKVLKIYEVKEKLIAENTAVIGYLLDFEIVDNSQKGAIKCACTSTWIKENDKWACAMHTETELEKN
ncbi:nuclear transport factor 2 family protein [Flavobacterium sp. LHD-80]|uniref:nuclear transport factor 2 family protein n=1 Tax=Flavobacterium sp. LHD-80 TaxID=3071411 RepID=UPI0027E13291|nr:nuclear transport factor 2 family protein [Flavobacterium sp. LHD-80]MDQ6472457.1 nuclear transport factor 2 family protein [Flavobacterium sp. LHD-80]